MTFISSKSRAHCCLFLAYIGAVIQAQAAIVVYTSEGAFDTAALEFGTQDFTDDLSSGSKSGSTVTLTDVTISGSGIATFPNLNNTNRSDGTSYLRFQVDENRPVTFTFNTPVTAIGFDINPRSQGVNDMLLVRLDLDRSRSASFSMPSSDITEFRGFVSDSAFTTFTVSDADGADDFYGIDNLVAYSAVPEPSTYAAILGLVCLGGAIACRRFKRS